MQLTASHQPASDVGSLQHGTLGRRMSGEVAGNGYQDMPALSAIAPFAELPHPGFQHLVSMEARILAQQRPRQGG